MAAAKTLNLAITATDKTGRVISGIARSLGGIKSLLVGIGAVGGLAALTKGALSAADSIAKTADAVGITTTALQQYGQVAEMAGVAQAQLDSGLVAFTKRLGEARQGTGAMATFLEKYDEGLLEVVKSSATTEDALDAMFEAISEAGSASDKAALSAAAFGRTAGVDMVNMVRDGVDAMRELRDGTAAIDERLLRGAETANDAMARLTHSVTVAYQSLLLALAPVIETIADWLTEALPAAVDIADRAWFLLRDSALYAVEGVVDALEALMSVLAQLPEFALGDVFLEWSEGLAAFSDKIHAVRTEVPIFASNMQSATASTAELARVTTETAIPAVDELNEAMKRQEEALDREAERITRVTETVYERIVAERELVDVLEEQGRISEETAARRRQQLGEEIRDLRRQAFESETVNVDSAERSADAWVGSFERAGDAVGSFVERGEFELENFLAFAIDAAQQIVSAFAGGLGGTGGGAGGGLLGSLGPVLGGIFGGPSGGISGGGGAVLGGGALFGAQHGARIRAAGGGAPDSQVIGMRVSPGEIIEATPPGHSPGGTTSISLAIDARGAQRGVEENIRRVVREELGPWRNATIREAVGAVKAEADAGGPFAKAVGRRKRG